jgi:hypothetical protein
MDGGNVSAGLRMIYGCARCMGLKLKSSSWAKFSDKWGKAQDLSVVDAKLILRELFGINRPFLLLIDELSKCNGFSPFYDKSIVKSVSEILDNDINTDVIVSSLSPEYIINLVTRSQRKVKYIVLMPLLNSKIGIDKVEEWSEKKLNLARSVKKNDTFCINLLKSTNLLVSGHPRSLEFLDKKAFSHDQSTYYEDIPNLFSGKKQSFTNILNYLSKQTTKICADTFSNSNFFHCFDELVLNPNVFVVNSSANFRTSLEAGTIFAHRVEHNSFIYSAIRACNLFEIMFGLENSTQDWNCNFRMKTFKILFKDIRKLEITMFGKDPSI